MTKEESIAAYQNKEFYTIKSDGSIEGPRKDIFYVGSYPIPTKEGYLYLLISKGKAQFLRPDEVFVREG